MKPQLTEDEIHYDVSIEEKNDILRLWNEVDQLKNKWNEDFQNYRRVRDEFIKGPNINMGDILAHSHQVLNDLLNIRNSLDNLERDKLHKKIKFSPQKLRS